MIVISDDLRLNEYAGIYLRKIFAKGRIRIYSGFIGDLKNSDLLAESLIKNIDIIAVYKGFKINTLKLPILKQGVAVWFRFDDFGSNWFDGAIGSSGQDLNLSNTNLYLDSVLTIDNFGINTAPPLIVEKPSEKPGLLKSVLKWLKGKKV